MLNEREIAIFHIGIMRSTAVQQGADVSEILAINDFVLRKFCPNITHAEFIQLDKDLDNCKRDIMESMMKGFQMAMGTDKYDFKELLGSNAIKIQQVEMLENLQKDIKDKKIMIDPQVIKNLEENIRSKVGAKKNEALEELAKRLKDVK